MKNRQILIGILAIVLVFGLVFVGCDQATNGSTTEEEEQVTKFEGTWQASFSSTLTFTFTKNSYTEVMSRGTIYGNFEFTDETITFKPKSTDPSGAPLIEFTMGYKLSENPYTLRLNRLEGDDGSGTGNVEGLFTKQ
jgi:hypothetical protein